MTKILLMTVGFSLMGLFFVSFQFIGLTRGRVLRFRGTNLDDRKLIGEALSSGPPCRVCTRCGRVGTGLPRGQERVPPSELIVSVSQQSALHPEETTWGNCYLSSSAGVAFTVHRFKIAALPPGQRDFQSCCHDLISMPVLSCRESAKPITGTR